MRTLILFCAALLAGWNASAAERVDGLYTARALVTGQREETRIPALRAAFRDILAKVSGDPSLLTDAKADALFDPSLAATLTYRDLMAGIPKKDEQGTRDRPFELTVEFDAGKIDTVLEKLGRRPWGAERPAVTAFVTVAIGSARFVPAAEGEPGGVQRQALLTAARQYGLPVRLPAPSEIAGGMLTAVPEHGDARLTGSMRFDEALPGWRSEWKLASGDGIRNWRSQDTTFDEAFRKAVRGTAQILSGNGAP